MKVSTFESAGMLLATDPSAPDELVGRFTTAFDAFNTSVTNATSGGSDNLLSLSCRTKVWPSTCDFEDPRVISARDVLAIDLHPAWEPGRVVLARVPDVPGDAMFEKRQYFQRNLGRLRRRLLRKPRGHPAANDNILFPSARSGTLRWPAHQIVPPALVRIAASIWGKRSFVQSR